MKIGITLPLFRDDADAALSAARSAEKANIDGVFVFDHLWPLNQPNRPALSALPMLGAISAVTTTVGIGPLVARVGLVPEGVLVAALVSIDKLSGGRLIVGLGIGDKMSEPENRAFGIEPSLPAVRLEALGNCIETLQRSAIPVWVGARSKQARAVGRSRGAVVNLWEATLDEVALESERGEVTWAGPLGGGAAKIRSHLGDLAEAGASWVVCAWPSSIDEVARAAALMRKTGC